MEFWGYWGVEEIGFGIHEIQNEKKGINNKKN